ncbi:hypothetical protein [Amycolatopsis sp. GM8]|uniref:hypothetical protein n=1 Tax=Amycolatopsis sp. GM8 TaxID=2896530 RepID=UPI001F4288D8|nr:hypothetical protein [Amycolatopsis sp. GM8]
MGKVGGRIDREVPEPNVSSFKRRRVMLPDGTYGYRVVRPDWEAILTSLRRASATLWPWWTSTGRPVTRAFWKT